MGQAPSAPTTREYKGNGLTGEGGVRNRRNAHIRGNVPGTDRVHLDVVLAPLVAESLGELAKGALGGCIRRDGDATLESENGAKVDDFASSEGDHMTPGCLAQEPGSFEIDIEDLGSRKWNRLFDPGKKKKGGDRKI